MTCRVIHRAALAFRPVQEASSGSPFVTFACWPLGQTIAGLLFCTGIIWRTCACTVTAALPTFHHAAIKRSAFEQGRSAPKAGEVPKTKLDRKIRKPDPVCTSIRHGPISESSAKAVCATPPSYTATSSRCSKPTATSRRGTYGPQAAEHRAV